MKRREFIARGSVISFGMAGSTSCQSDPSINSQSRPIVISTWDFGVRANEVAWEIIEKGGRALDAVEQGVRLIESDPDEQSVGYGGLPDREGHVTLDACLMDENSNCGSVAFLRDFKNPISIARRVMEQLAITLQTVPPISLHTVPVISLQTVPLSIMNNIVLALLKKQYQHGRKQKKHYGYQTSITTQTKRI